jgi:hypothetical protein
LAGTALGTPWAEKDHRHAVRHLVQLLHEDRALGLQAVDDELVVDDLVADVDRRAVALERQLDDVDRAVDARAKAARRRDQQVRGGFDGIAMGGPAERATSPRHRLPGERRFL